MSFDWREYVMPVSYVEGPPPGTPQTLARVEFSGFETERSGRMVRLDGQRFSVVVRRWELTPGKRSTRCDAWKGFDLSWCGSIGPRTTYEWDKQQPVSEELRHVLGFLYQQLPLRQAEGAEMWPMQPCTVYYRWMRGLVVPYDDLVVATWDAARSGIALAVAVEPGGSKG